MELERFSSGDKVRLKLAKEELDGTFLDSSDSSIVLIKLDSGYNIGVAKENILNGRILERNKEENAVEEEEKVKIDETNSNQKKKKIGLVITGGTIAAKLNPKTGGVHWLTDVEEFKRFYPEISERTEVKAIKVPFMIASESM